MDRLLLVPIGKSGQMTPAIKNLPEVAQEVLQMTASTYDSGGYMPPWIGYFALREGVCMGTCAFKSPPINGTVEIAYFTFPEFEGQGIATQMARSLVEMANSTDPRLIVRAQTLPVKNASGAILTKLGFKFIEAVEHPEDGLVWEWRK